MSTADNHSEPRLSADDIRDTVLAEAVCQTGAVIILTDPEGKIVFVNPAFEETYGYTDADVIGKTPRVLKSGKHQKTVYQQLWQTIKSGKIWRGRLVNRSKDGRLIHVNTTISPITDDRGEITYLLGIQHDVSIHAQKDRDERDIVLEISNAMRRAYSRDELAKIIARRICDLLGMRGAAVGVFDEPPMDEDRQQASIRFLSGAGAWDTWTGKTIPLTAGVTSKVLRNGEIYRSSNIHDDGRFLHPEWFGDIPAAVCIPLTVDDQYIGVLWAGDTKEIAQRDVNTLIALSAMVANALRRQSLHENVLQQMAALEAAQAKIIRTEKLAAMGTLAAGIAHEINNPLTSIILYVQLALQHVENHALKDDLEEIDRLAKRISRVIRGMLDFAHPDSGDKTFLSFREVMDGVMTFLQHEIRLRNVNLAMEFQAGLPRLYVNENQIQQVFVNLMMNAMHAMEGQTAKQEIHIKAYQDKVRQGDALCIHIEFWNNGPLIPESALSRIFDPFFTTKRKGKGTGLGLSITHSIILRHNGQIWVENAEKPRGVRFHIQLPVVDESSVLEKKKEGKISERSGKAILKSGKENARILLVDDEVSILEVFRRVLSRRGYEVDTSADGEDAFSRILQTDYDLVLCDIQMPNVNGIDIYQRLRKKRPEMLDRIVFISGDSINEETRAFMKTVGNRFLNKPIMFDELVETIAQALSDFS